MINRLTISSWVAEERAHAARLTAGFVRSFNAREAEWSARGLSRPGDPAGPPKVGQDRCPGLWRRIGRPTGPFATGLLTVIPKNNSETPNHVDTEELTRFGETPDRREKLRDPRMPGSEF
jgi:hypothetical protein